MVLRGTIVFDLFHLTRCLYSMSSLSSLFGFGRSKSKNEDLRAPRKAVFDNLPTAHQSIAGRSSIRLLPISAAGKMDGILSSPSSLERPSIVDGDNSAFTAQSPTSARDDYLPRSSPDIPPSDHGIKVPDKAQTSVNRLEGNPDMTEDLFLPYENSTLRPHLASTRRPPFILSPHQRVPGLFPFPYPPINNSRHNLASSQPSEQKLQISVLDAKIETCIDTSFKGCGQDVIRNHASTSNAVDKQPRIRRPQRDKAQINIEKKKYENAKGMERMDDSSATHISNLPESLSRETSGLIYSPWSPRPSMDAVYQQRLPFNAPENNHVGSVSEYSMPGFRSMESRMQYMDDNRSFLEQAYNPDSPYCQISRLPSPENLDSPRVSEQWHGNDLLDTFLGRKADRERSDEPSMVEPVRVGIQEQVVDAHKKKEGTLNVQEVPLQNSSTSEDFNTEVQFSVPSRMPKRSGTPPLLFGSRAIGNEKDPALNGKNDKVQSRLATAFQSAGLNGDSRLAKAIKGDEDFDWETEVESVSISYKDAKHGLGQTTAGSSLADISDSGSVSLSRVPSLSVRKPLEQHSQHPRYSHAWELLHNEHKDKPILMPKSVGGNRNNHTSWFSSGTSSQRSEDLSPFDGSPSGMGQSQVPPPSPYEPEPLLPERCFFKNVPALEADNDQWPNTSDKDLPIGHSNRIWSDERDIVEAKSLRDIAAERVHSSCSSSIKRPDQLPVVSSGKQRKNLEVEFEPASLRPEGHRCTHIWDWSDEDEPEQLSCKPTLKPEIINHRQDLVRHKPGARRVAFPLKRLSKIDERHTPVGLRRLSEIGGSSPREWRAGSCTREYLSQMRKQPQIEFDNEDDGPSRSRFSWDSSTGSKINIKENIMKTLASIGNIRKAARLGSSTRNVETYEMERMPTASEASLVNHSHNEVVSRHGGGMRNDSIVDIQQPTRAMVPSARSESPHLHRVPQVQTEAIIQRQKELSRTVWWLCFFLFFPALILYGHGMMDGVITFLMKGECNSFRRPEKIAALIVGWTLLISLILMLTLLLHYAR